ncbi:MAG TPA: ABC transporter ATP-binding protein [Mycobacteriales bacterium]|nr:ABC transporter ATP-binding protein [Mycobacteriales bacterium]
MLRLEAMSKRYGRGRWVFRDINLEVALGEVLAVTGGNGSGKSTLLRVLVGLSRPTSGRVSGRPDVVGYVPDRFTPSERLSATAYLTHIGRIRGLITKVAQARADALLDRLALSGGTNTALRALSKGNAQKVAVAQALMVPPRLLVLDEPWSGLDASTHEVLGEIIGETARGGGSVIFTDHRESTVGMFASRTYTMGREGAELTVTRPTKYRRDMEVVLTSRFGEEVAPHPKDWHVVEGVLDVAVGQEQIVVRVDPNRLNGMLSVALREGWSIETVNPCPAVKAGAR